MIFLLLLALAAPDRTIPVPPGSQPKVVAVAGGTLVVEYEERLLPDWSPMGAMVAGSRTTVLLVDSDGLRVDLAGERFESMAEPWLVTARGRELRLYDYRRVLATARRLDLDGDRSGGTQSDYGLMQVQMGEVGPRVGDLDGNGRVDVHDVEAFGAAR